MNSLTDLREVVDVVIGVDTHVHTHSAAVVDAATGGVLDEITATVLVHHGEADTMTPVAHSQHTADLIRGARLTIWPEQGHISLIAKIPDIAAELIAVHR